MWERLLPLRSIASELWLYSYRLHAIAVKRDYRIHHVRGKAESKEKINIKYAEVRKYIPSSVPYEQTGAYILKALEYYHRHLERQRGDAR